jgi:hypothetical protein
VHAPTADKSDDAKVRLHEELERAFDEFPNFYVKIWLGV